MFENILQAKLKICEYGKNNKQGYDYAFFIKVIPQYCIAHPYCARFLRH